MVLVKSHRIAQHHDQTEAEKIVRRIAAFVFAVLPALPVAAQGTYPNRGLYAPPGTPKPALETLSKALRAKLSSQIDLWQPIIEKAGIQAE